MKRMTQTVIVATTMGLGLAIATTGSASAAQSAEITLVQPEGGDLVARHNADRTLQKARAGILTTDAQLRNELEDRAASIERKRLAKVAAAEAAKNREASAELGGPSAWTGPKLEHPNGGAFPDEVLQWANLTQTVMAEHDVPAKYLPGILAQMQQESSGNPDAVNDWDSNAVAGTPSKGLLQVIAPTYQAYAKPGYKDLKYQAVPYTNIWASMSYVKDTYGMGKFKLWNAGENPGY